MKKTLQEHPVAEKEEKDILNHVSEEIEQIQNCISGHSKNKLGEIIEKLPDSSAVPAVLVKKITACLLTQRRRGRPKLKEREKEKRAEVATVVMELAERKAESYRQRLNTINKDEKKRYEIDSEEIRAALSKSKTKYAGHYKEALDSISCIWGEENQCGSTNKSKEIKKILKTTSCPQHLKKQLQKLPDHEIQAIKLPTTNKAFSQLLRKIEKKVP